MRRALAVLGLLLVATSTAHALEQADYGGAEDDLSAFDGVTDATILRATDLVQAAAQGRASERDAASDRVRELTHGFDRDLLRTILFQGTAPDDVRTLQRDLAAFGVAATSLASADREVRDRVAATRAPADALVQAERLTAALLSVAEEEGAVEDLEAAAQPLGERGHDVAPLLKAIEELRSGLDDLRTDLAERLALVQDAAALTLEANRRTVPLGGSASFQGFALDGGLPAEGTTVTVRVENETLTARVGATGRYRATWSVPLTDLPRTVAVGASATVGGQSLAAGPLTVRIVPVPSFLTLRVASTQMSSGTVDLPTTGTLDTAPFPEAGRRIALLVDGESVGTVNAKADGSFAVTAALRDLDDGSHELVARYASTDSRVASSESAPIRLLVGVPSDVAPGRHKIEIRQPGDLVEFLFFLAGLGIVRDTLLALVLVGLLAFAYNSFHGARPQAAEPLSPAAKAAQAALLAPTFPPLGEASATRLFAAFLDAARWLLGLPTGVTHRELADDLVKAGVDANVAKGAAQVFEKVRYQPAGAGPGDEDRLRNLLNQAWSRLTTARRPTATTRPK